MYRHADMDIFLTTSRHGQGLGTEATLLGRVYLGLPLPPAPEGLLERERYGVGRTIAPLSASKIRPSYRSLPSPRFTLATSKGCSPTSSASSTAPYKWTTSAATLPRDQASGSSDASCRNSSALVFRKVELAADHRSLACSAAERPALRGVLNEYGVRQTPAERMGNPVFIPNGYDLVQRAHLFDYQQSAGDQPAFLKIRQCGHAFVADP